jgi:hypothetical protein
MPPTATAGAGDGEGILQGPQGEGDRADRGGRELSGPLDGAAAPPELAAFNYVYFYPEPKKPGSGFGPGLIELVAVLKTDLEWLREHTRLLQRATEWDTASRPANRLLSGSDIDGAKAWIARRPKDAPAPTALHLDFIKASECGRSTVKARNADDLLSASGW